MTPKGEDIARRTEVLPWDLLRTALGTLDHKEKQHLTSILEKVAASVAKQVESKNGNR
jgi:hypothetical protein